MARDKAALYKLSNPHRQPGVVDQLGKLKQFVVVPEFGDRFRVRAHTLAECLTIARRRVASRDNGWVHEIQTVDGKILWCADLHHGATGDEPTYELMIFHSQGGGTVYWSRLQRAYLFWEPPDWGNYKKHDFMPEEWGIAGGTPIAVLDLPE